MCYLNLLKWLSEIVQGNSFARIGDHKYLETTTSKMLSSHFICCYLVLADEEAKAQKVWHSSHTTWTMDCYLSSFIPHVINTISFSYFSYYSHKSRGEGGWFGENMCVFVDFWIPSRNSGSRIVSVLSSIVRHWGTSFYVSFVKNKCSLNKSLLLGNLKHRGYQSMCK